MCGMVGQLNEPEKQPNKSQGKDLTIERKPEEKEGGCGGWAERHLAAKLNPAHP